MEVFVTGVGVVSALGIGVEANFNGLRSQKTGITSNTLLKGLFEHTFVGELPLSTIELKTKLNLSVETIIPRTALLGMLAAREALGTTVLGNDVRSGFINGSTVGGMDLSENYFAEAILQNDHTNLGCIATHDLGTVSQLIADYCGKPGYLNTISTACSSSANSIMLGARMIKSGLIDRVLVGGSDALSKFTINGFRSLMIYDNEICKPFDKDRKGLNLGEGAGYLLLENETSLIKSKNSKLAKLVGWHNANDAYHQTGTSPEGDGATKAMKGALALANLVPDSIDYINAHGTATQNNDFSESNALKRIFRSKEPTYSSTKGFTGHTLGAAGGIEAVYSVLSIMKQSMFPTINWQTKMNEISTAPVLNFKENVAVNTVMSNSFGFGGNSTSLIFTKA
jgi:3-oxoacyl-[acyl-carrier-protein] synthase-1